MTKTLKVTSPPSLSLFMGRGKGSVVGGNVWLTESVPPESKVIAEPPRTLVHQRESRKPETEPLHWDI